MHRLTVAAISFAALLTAGCGKEPGESKFGDVVELSGNPRVDLDRAYSIGDYKTAIPLIREKLEDSPEDGREWFRLGYALHSQEQYADAIEAYRNAAKFDETQRSISLYNWACALALGGEKNKAMAKLDEAVSAGFNRKRTMVNDTDLDSLRSSERFHEILGRVTPPAGSTQIVSEHTDMNFWVGDWELQNNEGARVARTHVESRQNGYVLQEEWDVGKADNGTVLTHFDPEEDVWKQTRISADGKITYFSGKFAGGKIAFEGRQIGQDGTVLYRRLTLSPDDDDRSVRHKVENSEDGEVWETVFTGKWVPERPRLTM